jgi:hypothetical protein
MLPFADPSVAFIAHRSGRLVLEEGTPQMKREDATYTISVNARDFMGASTGGKCTRPVLSLLSSKSGLQDAFTYVRASNQIRL